MNQNSSRSELRWADYVLAREEGDDLKNVWSEATESRRLIYVLADGFDPRTMVGLRRLVAFGIPKGTKVLSLGMPPTDNEVAQRLAAENQRELDELATRHSLDIQRAAYPQVSESRAAGLRIARGFIADGHVTSGCTVAVDVSAMPTPVHFALIGAILEHATTVKDVEVLVVVSDNPELDAAIVNVGTSSADPIGGFSHGLDLEGSKQVRIWSPVLGRGDVPGLRAIHERLEPREICPVLPFPATNPRHGDDLFIDYRQLLLEEMQVDPRDIIYADERNPFDLYRTLSRLNARYVQALAPLGDVKVVLSAHSSKLLSLGILLAAHEHRLPVVSAPPTSYALPKDFSPEKFAPHHQLVCLWLEGSPYR